MKTNYIIGIVIVLVILGIIGIGVWRINSGMSPSDKLVFGAWDGTMKNKSGQEVRVVYLFWGGGNYTVGAANSLGPVFERGAYSTQSGDNGSVTVYFEPDTAFEDAKQFSELGDIRSLSLTPKTINGVNVLVFPDGSQFVRSSFDLYVSQP